MGTKDFGLQRAETEGDSMKKVLWALALVCGCICVPGHAQEVSRPWEEYSKLIKSRESITALGPTLFGDEVSLSNGALSFSATDVSVPGNSRLPVALTRTFSVKSRKGLISDAPLADWEIDTPNISGVFAYGWNGWQNNRCSVADVNAARPPTVSSGSTYFTAEDYWQGNQANMPGGGEMLLPGPGTPKPSTGGPYYWMTSGYTYFSCLSSVKNGGGEGFIAITADGTRYWFDWMAQYVEPALKGGKGTDGQISRRRNVLYATRVEDRFGNWVTYTYTNASTSPARLTSIDANDGRQITVGYNAQGHIATVSNGTQTWSYQYSYPTSTTGTLTAVVLPDASQWTISFSEFSVAKIRYQPNVPEEVVRTCWSPGDVVTPGATGTITHPSGAAGEFRVEPTQHGRSNVPMVCANYSSPYNDDNDDYAYYPLVYDAFSLTKKRITGPGLTAAEWNYLYYADISFAPGTGPVCTSGSCMAPVCTSDSCAGSAKTEVTGPGGLWTRYTHGNSYRYNEGKLLRVEKGLGPTAIFRTEATNYLWPVAGQQFSAAIGISPQLRGDGYTSEYLRPQISNVITQDGVTFNWQVSVCGNVYCLDAFARPTSVGKWSALGYSKADVTEYYDNLALWVIGQVKRRYDVDTGIVMSDTDYDAATALPRYSYGYGTLTTRGKLLQTLGYYADGTVETVKDGRNNTTTLSGWKRGVPQLIVYPDTTRVSASVHDAGWVTSVVDENGFATGYGYDAMGRLASIAYPTGDSTVWDTVAMNFQQIGADEHGLPPGHWRASRYEGNKHVNTYYDALWRPVLEEALDAGNVAGTLSQTVKTYDSSGRLVFQSYPQRGVGNYWDVTQGTRTTYDVLDRVTQVQQDSELGVLTTTTEYLPNLQTRVTNPRRLDPTTSGYQAFDQPSYDAPVWIVRPDDQVTQIWRDSFGKPNQVRQSGPSASGFTEASRYFHYDAYQQLCKRLEPETGATVLGYDAAGNLESSASGVNAPSPTDCGYAQANISGRIATRSYDARNRLSTLRFPDGRGDQNWLYTPDGLPSQVSTYNGPNNGAPVVNAYTYNKRRLLTGESVSQPDWPLLSLGYGYDANGSLSVHTYPEGLTVDYAPNALGQPTRAGSYATGVSYYPNGAMAQFTYGNGIVHTLVQNARGLPDRSTDSYGGSSVLDDGYDYDANGNVAAISDGLPGGRGNRTMGYDVLDRLTSTVSPMFSPASYGYDALDNLRTVKVAGRDHTYVYDTTTNRLTNVANTVSGASVIGLGYDVQGNLASKNGVLYKFDFGNRLREVVGAETYRYDGHGRRVLAAHASQGDIVSMYSQDGVLRFQHDGRIGKKSKYITLNGSMVARLVDAFAPNVPLLSAPFYNTVGTYPVNWTAVPATTRYELEESANAGAWQQQYSGSGLGHSISGKPSGNYAYRGRACNAAGCGAWSEVATVTVELPPASPPTLSVPTAGLNGSYTVSWGTVSGAASYTLEESADGGTSWAASYIGNAQSSVFNGKAAGSYIYRAKACNPAGCSAFSGQGTVQVIYPPGAAPTPSAPAQSTTGSYTISWTGVATATSYQLDESAHGGAWTLIHNGAATSMAVSGKSSGTYSYRARACNAAGCGPTSGSVSVQEIDPPSTAPTLSAPAVNITGSYTVSWSSIATATSYQLEESAEGAGWALIHNAAATSVALGRSTGTTYSYQARACNAAGCGPTSASIGVQKIVYGAQFVGQSVPASIEPGQVIAVSVQMRNTGNTTWNAADAYRLGSQNVADNWRWGLNRVAVPGSVAPGQIATFNFNITGPTPDAGGGAGMRAFQWQMLREGITWFGEMTPNTGIWLDAPDPDPCGGRPNCHEN